MAGVIATVGLWLLGETASYIYSLFLNSPYEKLIQKKDEQKLKEILADYNFRFEKQLEMVSQDGELVIEGLKEYTERELFDGFFASLMVSNYVYRKEEKRKLLEGAYEAAHAKKAGQKANVQQYINTVFDFLNEFTLQKLSEEQLVQKNLLEDSLIERMEQSEKRLHKEIERVTRYLSDKNSFASMIDQIQSKEANNNEFHYLNETIGFWGRDEEMQVLKEFLEDERPVLYTAVIAPGGCGKSKLIYEFVKQNRYNTNWEMQYLDGICINRLLDFYDYCYPRNLVLIVDYAGVYADQLGKWLFHLLQMRAHARPEKLRLILLEREREAMLGDIVVQPAWKRSLEASGNQKQRIEEIQFVKEPFTGLGEMRPLDDASIKKMMKRCGEKQGRSLRDEEIEALLAYLKKMGSSGIASAKPLIALMMTQSYIDGQSVLTWKTQDMVEYFLDRYEKQCRYLCNEDENTVAAVNNLLFYATAMGAINLDNESNEYLKKDIEILENVPEESYIALLCGINQDKCFRNIIMPMEPDILGEYFVLKKLYLASARQKKLQSIMTEFWKVPEKCFAFLARSIRDYGERKEFRNFFINQVDILLPTVNSKLKAELKSKLLHLMLTVISGKEAQTVFFERMQSLYETYPKYQKVVEDYAAFLMMEFKNHFGDFSKQDENVERINKLRMSFPASTYLDMIYGKSLYNQVASYSGIFRQQKTPERMRGCAAKIAYNLEKMEKLCKERPDNDQVALSFAKARMHAHFYTRV